MSRWRWVGGACGHNFVQWGAAACVRWAGRVSEAPATVPCPLLSSSHCLPSLSILPLPPTLLPSHCPLQVDGDAPENQGVKQELEVGRLCCAVLRRAAPRCAAAQLLPCAADGGYVCAAASPHPPPPHPLPPALAFTPCCCPAHRLSLLHLNLFLRPLCPTPDFKPSRMGSSSKSSWPPGDPCCTTCW